MSFSLHIVPHRRSTEVTVSLLSGDSLSGPVNQSRWPNWVRVLQALSEHLEPEDRRVVQQSLSVGSPVWLQHLALSDSDLERLGF